MEEEDIKRVGGGEMPVILQGPDGYFNHSAKPKTKTNWQDRFDKKFVSFSWTNAFGDGVVKHRDRLVYELKDFISKELKREREEMGEALKIDFKTLKKILKPWSDDWPDGGEYIVGLGRGGSTVLHFINQAIENYLNKKKEEK